MLRFQPGKDRWRLGFKDAVLANFKFLSEYGLKPVNREDTFVRYESKKVFANVYHGRGSYVIGVEIGRLDRPEKYGLGYIVSWAGKQVWEAEGFGRTTIFQVSTPEGVRNVVPKVAELTKRYGSPFLSGKPDFYDELEKANERSKAAYSHAQMLLRIREEANTAWAAKDFARVAELLEPVKSDLTAVESKRLTYAEKHSQPVSPSAGSEIAKIR